MYDFGLAHAVNAAPSRLHSKREPGVSLTNPIRAVVPETVADVIVVSGTPTP